MSARSACAWSRCSATGPRSSTGTTPSPTWNTDIRGLYSVEPYASFLGAYQYSAYLRGPLLGVILAAGGLGAVLRRRTALLPWGSRRRCWWDRWRCSTSTTATSCR
ncbi:hypothetical protein [Streptosporangium sp. 'caverna']|uniref:hypothetical protein n=1 Tax=Streptosporangium sp. 'caverna' TaxID=2202249 RepID=UPI0019550CB7|nr:hypothetical protein [Streptosporangium sp. 'caverna']